MAPQITLPAAPTVSQVALESMSRQDMTPAPVVVKPAEPRPSLKNQIAQLMETSKAETGAPQQSTSSLSPLAIDPTDADRAAENGQLVANHEEAEAAAAAALAAKPVEKVDSKPVTPGAGTATDNPNFKSLKEALTARDAKVAELETELEKVRPSAAKVTELEDKIAEMTAEVNESQEWRARYGLLRSDEFHRNIAAPRQQIAQTIKAELKTDGIDETLWEQMQTATSRVQLEEIVETNVKSKLLRDQVYTAFFQDLELRKKEEAAMKAPAQYLETMRAEELAAKNTAQQMAKQSLETTWTAALGDADQMMLKLGENKIIETVMIEGNTDHNEKVVKPLLQAAHAGARAQIEERVAMGAPVTREDAARIIYLWRQAIAAQHANQDRLRWYQHAQKLEQENTELKARVEKKASRDNPDPGSRVNGASSSQNGFRRGGNLAETITNFRAALEGES